jgi:hypothetical protein
MIFWMYLISYSNCSARIVKRKKVFVRKEFAILEKCKVRFDEIQEDNFCFQVNKFKILNTEMTKK